MVSRRAICALGATLALAGIILAWSATAQAAQTQNEELAMFGEMMPVFSSPRCVNCHGGINPFKGDSHEAGPIDVPLDADGDMTSDDSSRAVCQECHTQANGQWHTAPKAISFVGKDTLALCRQMRGSTAGGGFVEHITNDELIGLAFVGQRGIGDDSAFGPLAPVRRRWAVRTWSPPRSTGSRMAMPAAAAPGTARSRRRTR